MADKETSTEAYAVVETGGKQYMIKEKDTLKVELLEAKTGDTIELKQVLALSDGKKLQVGTPEIKDASIKCKVLDEEVKGKKVINFKKKRRKGYKRKVGHRQKYTFLEVTSIA